VPPTAGRRRPVIYSKIISSFLRDLPARRRLQIDRCPWFRSTTVAPGSGTPTWAAGCFATVSHRLPRQGVMMTDGNLTTPEGAALTILVVEDEFWIRLWASDFLRACGHQMFKAPTGDEATEILAPSSIPFDVGFSDIGMPGPTNGFGLARWVRIHRPEVRILLTSGAMKSVEIAGTCVTMARFCRSRISQPTSSTGCPVRCSSALSNRAPPVQHFDRSTPATMSQVSHST